MVTLGRLLAASDSPDSTTGHSRPSHSANSKQWVQDHALSEEVFASVFGPEGSNAGLVSGTLGRAFSAHSAFLGEPVQSRDADRPSIPLDQYIADLGPEATIVENMISFKRALSHFGCPSEEAIAKAFVLMARSKRLGRSEADADAMSLFQLMTIFEANGHDAPNEPASPTAMAVLWNFEAFVLVVNDVAEEAKCTINWRLVIRSLDSPDLVDVLDATTFADIAKAYTSATGGSLIPATSIVEQWENRRAQNQMLSNALMSPELVDWGSLEAFPGATADDCLSPYARIGVLERMVDLDTRQSLQDALSTKPDLVLLCLACAKPENNTHIQQQLIVTLVSSLISKFPASARTIRQMWKFAPALIAGGLLAMWRKDTSSSPLVLDIALDNHALQEILGPPMPLEFVFDIALLTYRRQPFPLETWLSDYFVANGSPALSHCILQLAERIVAQNASGAGNLSLDAVRIVLRCLYNSITSAPRHMTLGIGLPEDLKRVHDAYILRDARTANLEPAEDVGDRAVLLGSSVNHDVPRLSLSGRTEGLQNLSGTSEAVHVESANAFVHGDGVEANGQSELFSKDVEEEVNVHFHSLYKGAITTEQAVELLRRLQRSDNHRDRKVFECMIHTLFDEYRFFNNYPDKELRITGLLFGAFVQYSLFTGNALVLALERVLNALQQVDSREGHDENSKQSLTHFDNSSTKDEQIGRMTKFGLCALDRFRKRLPEWPQFCARVLEIPHLKAIAPELLGEVESVVNNATTYPSSVIGRSAFVSDASLGVNVRTEIPPSASLQLSELRDGAASSVLASPTGSVTTHRMSPTLEAASQNNQDFEVPENAVCEKISFIFNNLSSTTLDDKKDQLVEFLRPEHFPYFVHYIVVKRALNEVNHHDLYIEFLDKLTSHIPKLFKLVLDKSVENVRILLSSDKIATNSGERVLLRTLGAWIGALTLGRNKPILARDLDLKKLLLDAYTRGRLSPVVPFVCKVLVGSLKSKVFQPSNPWIKAMLSILKEICHVEDLKLNLRFEFPSLISTLKIDEKDIVPSNLLKDVQEPSRVNNPDIRKSPQASPRSSAPSPEISTGYSNIGMRAGHDTSILSLGAVSSGISASMSSGLEAGISSGLQSHIGVGMDMGSGQMNNAGIGSDAVADLATVLGGTSILPRNHSNSIHAVTGNGATNVQSGAPANGQMVGQQQVSTPSGPEPTIIPNFANYVTISPSLTLFQASPNLKPLLSIAIDRALKDIIQPVVERSCAIASLTTRELTLKDFANEPNTGKIRKAAQQMVQQLAGSLALVTCKEPLRVSMGNHVRSILTSAVGSDSTLIEQTSQVVCGANLEMGCAIIERAAKDKAARDLNEVIGPAFSSIRRQQQTGYGLSGPPGPDVLKVYADFSRLPRAILGEGNRLGPSPLYPTPAPVLVHPIGTNTSTAIGASMGLSPSTALDLPAISTSQGPVLSEKLHDPRFGMEKESVYATIRAPVTSSGVHSQISASPFDTVGESAPSSSRALSSTVNPHATNATDVASGRAARSPPVMAPPAAMAAAMHRVVEASSASQSSRLQHNVHPSVSVSGSSMDEALSTPEVLEKFNLVYAQLTSVIAEVTSIPSAQEVILAGLPGDHEVHQLWTQIPLAVKKSVTADEASMAVAQKVFKRLYEGNSSLYREVHVALLDGLRESCRRLSKELVIWLAYSEERKKLNRECIVALLKPNSLINITSYDELLSKTMDNGRNTKALDFAAFLVQRAVIDEPLATPAELALTLEAMAKIGRRPNPPALPSAPNGLLALVEAGRNASTRTVQPSASGDHSEATSGSHRVHKDIEHSDPAGSREFVSSILTEWQRMVTSEVPHQVLTTFLGHIRSKTLNTEESRERFCRLAVEMVVAVTSTALLANSEVDGASSELAEAPYTAVESTVRLVSALCRAETSHSNDSLSRSSYILSSFLTALVKNILKSSEHGDVRPHYRMFIGLLTELSTGVPPAETGDSSPGATAQSDNNAANGGETEYVLMSRSQAASFLDAKNEGLLAFALEVSGSGNGLLGGDGTIGIANFGVLALFVGALMACSPRAAPGFSFCWLQLISGRNILPRLLNASNGEGWPLFRQLLVSMLAFLAPHLRCAEHQLSGAIKHLYKGTLRVLLVLLHDFPEFLCDYHFALCDVIPSNCIQLRNLVLAAFPKNMLLPDPFRAELQAGQLPEMSLQPRILSNYTGALVCAGVKGAVDNFLQNATFGGSIANLDISPRLMIHKSDSDQMYNVPAINALVLYVGQHALSRPSHSSSMVVNGAATKFFQTLLKEMDAEGQYYLINAIANQLRYPNIHTHYFSSVLLHLFREAPQDQLKEQITRVLVERLIANRPHPWGLLITFIDLIKNPSYSFWTHGFVRCAPQIEHLFENVARFCIGPALQQNAVVSG